MEATCKVSHPFTQFFFQEKGYGIIGDIFFAGTQQSYSVRAKDTASSRFTTGLLRCTAVMQVAPKDSLQ